MLPCTCVVVAVVGATVVVVRVVLVVVVGLPVVVARVVLVVVVGLPVWRTPNTYAHIRWGFRQ